MGKLDMRAGASVEVARDTYTQRHRPSRRSEGNLKYEGRPKSKQQYVPTLRQLIAEYRELKSSTLKIWAQKKKNRCTEAERRTHAVFSELLDVPVTEIAASDFSNALLSYVPTSGKRCSSTQLRKARMYLLPVLDWAASREQFQSAKKGRRSSLDVADLRDSVDPMTIEQENCPSADSGGKGKNISWRVKT